MEPIESRLLEIGKDKFDSKNLGGKGSPEQ